MTLKQTAQILAIISFLSVGIGAYYAVNDRSIDNAADISLHKLEVNEHLEKLTKKQDAVIIFLYDGDREVLRKAINPDL